MISFQKKVILVFSNRWIFENTDKMASLDLMNPF